MDKIHTLSFVQHWFCERQCIYFPIVQTYVDREQFEHLTQRLKAEWLQHYEKFTNVTQTTNNEISIFRIPTNLLLPHR